MKLTAKQIEELAVEIRKFLIDNSLWIDTTIYFNGKAFSTGDRQGHFYYNDPNHLVVLEDMDPKQYFECVADPHILSMSFEGDFCGCLNFYNEYGADFDNRIQEGFSAILDRYDLYYELGHHWNLSCHPNNPDNYDPPQPKQEPIHFLGDRVISPESAVVPEKLQNIQKEWQKRADAYGDAGSCVLGAGFKFQYESQEYFMPPMTCWQGSSSWEHCKDDIEALLRAAGATEVAYEWGRMD